MRTRVLFDLLCVVVIYVLYWLVVYLASLPEYNWLALVGVYPSADLDEEQFLAAFQQWALVVMGASLVAVFAWYVIGEWGPKPHATSRGTWFLLWLLSLVITLAVGFVSFQFGPMPGEGAVMLAMVYLGSGALFHYLATLLFSPVNVKYVVPGARWIRRW